MKFNDLKITTQLRLGLGLILTLVVVLGAFTWIETDLLLQQTSDLYDHPFQVRRSLGKLESDIEGIARCERDLLLAGNGQETMAFLQGIELKKTDAERQFILLADRYLGPPDDITTLQDNFVKWGALRDETIQMIRAGKTAEAGARIRPGSVQDVQIEVVRSRFQKIDNFARNKAKELYQGATEQNDFINRQVPIIVSVILLLSLIFAWLMLKEIKLPLTELTAAAEQFRHGKLDVRSRYASANEFGTLSAAFNAMAEILQTEIRIGKNAAQLASVMLREDEVHAFCRELLKALLQQTGSQIGAVYFLNETKTAFEHFESIGLGAGARAAFSAAALEGELGAVLATRQIQRITDIPADTRFAFAAVSGEFKPREILTIPVVSGHSVSAVISLASVHAYDAPAIGLINEIWSVLTARMNGVLAFRKIQELAGRLEHQNVELDAQQRELIAQTAEVTEQNTELEMQKRQLDEANRLKSAFLSNMSHELRTPLNSVIALAGVLGRRLASTIPAEEYGYLEIIERNGKVLLALINDVLDLSRIEAGREEISISRFSLRELTDELAAMLGPLAAEKKLALLNQVPADLPLLTSDPHLCRHILQNIVGNAVKFTEQGQITITARRTGDEIEVVVTDTGIGIAADQQPFIFDEFRQVDASNSRKYGGSGLGLAIAKKYARLLGGGITVESAPGQGSTFTLRLPLALELSGAGQTLEMAQPPVASAAGPAPAGRGQSILVVEDNEPAIIQLTDILQAQGYRVRVAHNGAEALAHIKQTVPDAMILDLMMPGVDGFQVLQAIRETEPTAHLPVLILTAKHVTGEELRFLKSNHVHQLIQKGDINKAGLLAAVARMVAPPPERPDPRPFRRRSARTGKPIVLVVEDNPDSLLTAIALLDDRYQVITASDGRIGVEQARRHQPDLILMDIAMPVMDGVQALQRIREDEALRHIPVIALTASAMQGDKEAILAHGFDDYLSKPLDAELLLKTLGKALD